MRLGKVPIALLALAQVLAAACAEEIKPRERVLAYIAETERLTRGFVYREHGEGLNAEVIGDIEDGFRYQAILKLDGDEVFEQIADDDVLAVRVIDAAKIPSLASGTAPTSQVITDVLTQGRWVVDPSGAPPILRTSTGPNDLGSDPVRNAVNVLRYVRIAIDAAQDVRQYRDEDLDPAYRPSEDRFPKPDDKAGERRFDLVRLPLPTGGIGGGFDQLPQTPHFRKMAIYVRGTRIVRILEEIEVDGHADFEQARKKGRRRLLGLLKALEAAQGVEKVTERRMSVDFSSLGAKISIRQPSDALTASLKGILGPTQPEGLPEGGSEADQTVPAQTPGPAASPAG